MHLYAYFPANVDFLMKFTILGIPDTRKILRGASALVPVLGPGHFDPPQTFVSGETTSFPVRETVVVLYRPEMFAKS